MSNTVKGFFAEVQYYTSKKKKCFFFTKSKKKEKKKRPSFFFLLTFKMNKGTTYYLTKRLDIAFQSVEINFFSQIL